MTPNRYEPKVDLHPIRSSSPAAKVHRVAHRLGVLISGPAIVFATVWSSFVLYEEVGGYQANVDYYRKEAAREAGRLLDIRQGKGSPYISEVEVELNLQRAKLQLDILNENGRLGEAKEPVAIWLFAVLAATVFYAAVRGIGWVIAGMFL